MTSENDIGDGSLLAFHNQFDTGKKEKRISACIPQSPSPNPLHVTMVAIGDDNDVDILLLNSSQLVIV